MKRKSSAVPSGRLIRMAAVLLLAFLAGACLWPGGGYGRGEHWMSSREIRNRARTAVLDYLIDRYGPDCRPRASSVYLQGYNYDEARVTGRASFYRTPQTRRRTQVSFRCFVDRRNGRVLDINFY